MKCTWSTRGLRVSGGAGVVCVDHGQPAWRADCVDLCSSSSFKLLMYSCLIILEMVIGFISATTFGVGLGWVSAGNLQLNDKLIHVQGKGFNHT